MSTTIANPATTVASTTTTTATTPTSTSTTTSSTTTSIPAQRVVDTILADVNAVVPNFSSLVSAYRLLVGAAEEIHRTPGIPVDVFDRAVRRFDRTGNIIDILIDLLCCKISFSSEFLGVTCAPVDIFRLLANRTATTDTPRHTAEQILQIELLRLAIEQARQCCEDGDKAGCCESTVPIHDDPNKPAPECCPKPEADAAGQNNTPDNAPAANESGFCDNLELEDDDIDPCS